MTHLHHSSADKVAGKKLAAPSVPAQAEDAAQSQLANISWIHPDSNDSTNMRALGRQELNLQKAQDPRMSRWDENGRRSRSKSGHAERHGIDNGETEEFQSTLH